MLSSDSYLVWQGLYVVWKYNCRRCPVFIIQSVPLATEPGISLIILPQAGGPLFRVATIRRTTDTFFFISNTTNILLFKFRCNIFNAGFGSEWDTLLFSFHFKEPLNFTLSSNNLILISVSIYSSKK
jgi:hypothetical protein